MAFNSLRRGELFVRAVFEGVAHSLDGFPVEHFPQRNFRFEEFTDRAIHRSRSEYAHQFEPAATRSTSQTSIASEPLRPSLRRGPLLYARRLLFSSFFCSDCGILRGG